jgi:hypothetical protein
MGRHFYRANFKTQARQDHVDLSNAFVAFTHLIGLSKFFSFTPDIFDRQAWREDHKNDQPSRHKDN